MKKKHFFSKASVCVLLSLVFGNSLFCCGQDSNYTNPYIDRAVFPKGYSILTSDNLMFPDNVSDFPVKLDSHRQLFVDDYLIASMSNLSRRYHQPQKHPKNPLVVSDRPWENPHRIILNSVIYDKKMHKFRMWYISLGKALYAESRDGIKWVKPDLGLVEYEGSKKNNILIENGGIQIIRINPKAQIPNHRFTAFVGHKPPLVKEYGWYIYHSPDGIHWKGDLGRCVMKHTENKLLPAVGMGDTSVFRYDPVLNKYICDAKFNLYFPQGKKYMESIGVGIASDKNRIKLRTMLESDDLVHWTRPRFILFPDEHDDPDCQIYSHISFVYESMWLGMVRIFHMLPTNYKQVDVQLSYSRDGRHWSRPAYREPFIPLGEPDSWEPDYTAPALNGPILVNDELWFFYRGCRNAERDKVKHWKMVLGLAKLRRDGFVSLNAGDTPGQVVTRPLTFTGKKLFVNADVEKDGWVKAAVLTRDSNSIDSYTLEDSVGLTKDTTKGRMTWKSKRELAPPKDNHVRLVFQLKNAKLYSFWVE